MTGLRHATQLADRLARLLRDEIAAIGQGKLGELPELAARKSVLLEEWEQIVSGELDHEVGADTPEAARLRKRLAEVQDLVAQDLALLKRMTEATGAIAEEITRIRDRHGLSGTYGPDGEQPQKPVSLRSRLDQSV